MTSQSPFVRDRLAAIALDIRYEDLPQEVVHETKRLILDTLGCLYGGMNAAPTRGVAALARELGGTAQATIVGGSEKTSAPLACLVNGTALRYLDANDYYFGRDPSHASGNLAPALAVAEWQGLSGREVILAMVVGLEIQHRLNDNAGTPSLWLRGWHHGTEMAIASAALTARLMDLDPVTAANAIAIATCHNNTITETMRGTMATMKATVEAVTAKQGIEAVLLARAGITGPESAFEGKFGWGPVVAGEIDYEALTAPTPGRYKLMEDCMKPFAALALGQGMIEAAIRVSFDNKLDPDAVQKIHITLPQQVLDTPVMDPSKFDPQNKETADHSPPYLVCRAMLDGTIGPRQFADEKIWEPAVRNLMAKVQVAADPDLDPAYPKAMGGGVAVTLTDGSVLKHVCRFPPGHPENRLSRERLHDKFRGYAEQAMSADRMDEAIAATEALDGFDRIGDYLAELRVG